MQKLGIRATRETSAGSCEWTHSYREHEIGAGLTRRICVRCGRLAIGGGEWKADEGWAISARIHLRGRAA